VQRNYNYPQTSTSHLTTLEYVRVHINNVGDTI